MLRLTSLIILLLGASQLFGQTVEWYHERGRDTTQGSFINQVFRRPFLNDDGSIITLNALVSYANTVIDLDPGPGVYNYTMSSSQNASFVQRFSSQGDLEWTGIFRSGVHTYIDAGWTEQCMNYIDDDGCIYFFISRNPNGLSTTLEYIWNGQTATIGFFGTDTRYLIKLRADGKFLWKVRFNNQNPYPRDIFVIDDKLVLHGLVAGTRDYDPSAAAYNITIPNSITTNFLIQLDTAGNFIKARAFYNPAQQANGFSTYDVLAVNSNHEIIIPIRMSNGPFDIDPGPGTKWVQTNGTVRNYLVKLDSNWNYSWHHEWPRNSTNNDGLTIVQVAFDANDDLVVAGNINGDVYINSWNSTLLTQADPLDDNILVAKFNGSGVPIWYYRSRTFDSYATTIWPTSLDISKQDGSIIVASIYQGDSLNLNPIDSLDVLPKVNFGNDYGLACAVFDSTGTYSSGFGLSNDSSLINDGALIYDRNTYYLYIQALAAADIDPTQDSAWIGKSPTVLFPNITCIAKYNHCLLDTGSIEAFACASFSLEDTTIYETGIYEYAVHLEGGCDSIVILNVQIAEAFHDTIDTTICTPTYLVDQLITESGQYAFAGTTQLGCDSITVWNVTYPVLNDGVIFYPNEQKLKAVEASADSYQWYECDSAGALVLILGDVSQSITKPSGGSYVVILEKGGCSDTSDCKDIWPVGMDELQEFELDVFPNPINDQLFVRSDLKISAYSIHGVDGNLVRASSFPKPTSSFSIRLDGVASGLYIIELRTEHGVVNREVVISSE